jgi:hypothetical protein
MAAAIKGEAQILNIIRRAQTLILNVKLLGADVTQAKDLLENAKNSLNNQEYDAALKFAMSSLKEVMRLKKDHEEGKLPAQPQFLDAPAPAESAPAYDQDGEEIPVAPQVQQTKKIPMAKPLEAKGPDAQDAPATEGHEQAPGPAGGDQGSRSQIGLALASELSNQVPVVDENGLIFGHEFIPGLSFLIEESRADKCFVVFQKLLEQDFAGLIITRTNPKIIRRKYELGECEMLWLTDRESTTEPTISPSLENMIYVAEEYIDGHEKPLLILDGLEYLISNNTFNSVLRFIRRLIDKISESDAILLIGASQGALKDQELKLLEKEMTPVLIR